jgi:predicted transcriptional regulator
MKKRPSKPVPKQPPTSTPTDAELRILGVLWHRGPSTVREVHDELAAHKPAGYTTTLKFMQIMHDKRLVTRDDSQRTHVYTAAVRESDTQLQATRDLMSRFFGGSAARLVQQALSAQPASREELARVRAILTQLERESEDEIC